MAFSRRTPGAGVAPVHTFRCGILGRHHTGVVPVHEDVGAITDR